MDLLWMLTGLVISTLCLWLGYSLAERKSAWLVSELRVRLSEAQRQMNVEAKMIEVIEAVNGSTVALEKMERTTSQLVLHSYNKVMRTKDLQYGEERDSEERSQGRRTIEMPASDVTEGEGFMVDGVLIAPNESLGRAFVNAKPS